MKIPKTQMPRIFIIKFFVFFLALTVIPTGCVKLKPDPYDGRMENFPCEWEFLSRAVEDIPSHPLTLEEILALALEQNLDLLVMSREAEYQYEVVTGARLKMLPALVFNSEISGRNRNTGMFSKSLEPSVPPAPPSISVEEQVFRYDFTFTYNLLDFGISYFRARQEANKAIMREAEYERAQQMLITNVVTQYWKARVAQKGLSLARESLPSADSFLDSLNQQVNDQIMSKDIALQYQVMLLRLEQQYYMYEQNYLDAMYQLAKLMGLPDACFELAEEDFDEMDVNIPDPCELGELALLNRPELYGLDAEERVKIQDAYMSMLQLFPTLAPFVSYNYDQNLYLIYHRWMVGGIRIAWNLLSTPTNFQMMLANTTGASVTQLNRLAMSIGILTQLNLAYLSYFNAKEHYRKAKQLSNKRQNLFETWEIKWKFGDASALDLLANYRLEAIISAVDELKALGEVQATLEQMNNALGLPFHFNYLKVN